MATREAFLDYFEFNFNIKLLPNGYYMLTPKNGTPGHVNVLFADPSKESIFVKIADLQLGVDAKDADGATVLTNLVRLLHKKAQL